MTKVQMNFTLVLGSGFRMREDGYVSNIVVYVFAKGAPCSLDK